MIDGLFNDINTAPMRQVIDYYVENWSPGNAGTQRVYRASLGLWLTYLGEGATLADLSDKKVDQFKYWALEIRKLSPATVNTHISAMRALCTKIADYCPQWVNPCRSARPLSLRPSDFRGFTEQERIGILQSLEQLDENNWYQISLKTYVACLFYTGMRPSEPLEITLDQLDPDLHWVRMVKGKGDRYRDIFIGRSGRAILQRYLERRESILNANFPSLKSISPSLRGRYPLFVSTTLALADVPITFRANYITLRRHVLKYFGISELHRFRHDYGFRHASDLVMLADQLGHADPKMTRRYAMRPQSMFEKHFDE